VVLDGVGKPWGVAFVPVAELFTGLLVGTSLFAIAMSGGRGDRYGRASDLPNASGDPPGPRASGAPHRARILADGVTPVATAQEGSLHELPKMRFEEVAGMGI